MSSKILITWSDDYYGDDVEVDLSIEVDGRVVFAREGVRLNRETAVEIDAPFMQWLVNLSRNICQCGMRAVSYDELDPMEHDEGCPYRKGSVV